MQGIVALLGEVYRLNTSVSSVESAELNRMMIEDGSELGRKGEGRISIHNQKSLSYLQSGAVGIFLAHHSLKCALIAAPHHLRVFKPVSR